MPSEACAVCVCMLPSQTDECACFNESAHEDAVVHGDLYAL
jgi:hypothetical protein